LDPQIRLLPVLNFGVNTPTSRSGRAPAGCALAAPRLWLAAPWPRPAAWRPWLVEPPQPTHEVHKDLLGNSYFWSFVYSTKWYYHCSHNLHVTYTYEPHEWDVKFLFSV
jgi:hypothetical protein